MGNLHKDLPMGFGMALAQNPEALNAFARLSEEQQQSVLDSAHSASSKMEMRKLVNDLIEREHFTDYLT